MSILLTLGIALIGWKLAIKLKLPAPAMLGSMLAVGITNIIFEYAFMPVSIKIFTQAISGAYIGSQISKTEIKNIRYLIKPFLLLIALLTFNTFFMGIIMHQLCDLDMKTALLSCVAGGVTDISLIAMDMNADVGIVAMMQTSRLVFVLLFFPYWIQFLTKHETTKEVDEQFPIIENNKITLIDRILSTQRSKIIATLLLSILFGYLGYKSNIPAASMVFPMMIIVVFNCITSSCKVPIPIKNIAQLLAGALVGASVHSSTFSNFHQTVIPVLLLLLSYWILNWIFGYLTKRWDWLDLKSALFASAPGGATDMALIAADLNADLTKIALIQLMRTTYVVAVTPMLILIFLHFFE